MDGWTVGPIHSAVQAPLKVLPLISMGFAPETFARESGRHYSCFTVCHAAGTGRYRKFATGTLAQEVWFIRWHSYLYFSISTRYFFGCYFHVGSNIIAFIILVVALEWLVFNSFQWFSSSSSFMNRISLTAFRTWKQNKPQACRISEEIGLVKNVNLTWGKILCDCSRDVCCGKKQARPAVVP